MKFLSLTILLSLLCSCEKDEPESHIYTAKESMLLGKTWLLSDATIQPAFDFQKNGTLSTDAYAHMALCVRDNLYTMKENDVLFVDEASYKCHPQDLPQRNGVWQLLNAESIMNLDGLNYRLVSVTDSSFVLSFESYSGGVTYTRTHFFKKAN